jgi:hypothetical protein
MARPTTRDEFIEYALTRLGKGALTVNVTDEQLEDRLDDALQFLQEYHYDFIESEYFKHEVTQPEFEAREINIPERIITVNRIFRLPNNISNPFDTRYQFALSDLNTYGSIDLIGYTMTRSHLNMLNQLLSPDKAVRFSRIKGKLKIDTDWRLNIPPTTNLMLNCNIIVNPEDHEKLWDSRRFKEYYTALIKNQWADNMGKMKDVTLIGGVKVNAETLKKQAQEEIEKIEKAIRDENEIPLGPMWG